MDQLTAGARLGGRYSLLERVGVGGMADVWRAHDDRLGRDVAVKVVRASEEVDLARFEAEVATHAALDHPSIVAVLDAAAGSEQPYLVLAYVDGPPLHAEISRGPIPPERVRPLAVQLAGALDHAHARGIVHRDVKPGNVLVTADGTAVLSDFGIARLDDATRLTQHGTVWGSAAYIAPEQLRGERVGPATDVYSLGLVLLEALTAERPYDGTAVEVAMARLSRPPTVPDSLPDPWPALLRRMLATDPADRPSAGAVARSLDPSAPGPPEWGGRDPATTVPLTAVDDTAAHTAALPLVAATGGGDRRPPLAWMLAGIAAVMLAAAVALVDGSPARTADTVPAAPASTVDVAGDPATTTPTDAPPPPPEDGDERDDDNDEEEDGEGGGNGNRGGGNGNEGGGNGRGDD